MGWEIILEMHTAKLRVSLKGASPDLATLGSSPRDPRDGVGKHKHTEAALLGSWIQREGN